MELPAFLEVRGAAAFLPLLRAIVCESCGSYSALPVERARVYSSSRGEHVDEERRQCLKVTARTASVFDLLEATFVSQLPVPVGGARWQLLRGHYDVLVYGPGDFFLRHRDFAPVSSALIQHYAALLCLEADCEGGRTALWPKSSEGQPEESDASCTPGDALLIRVDVEHEGRRVISGRKVVLRLDLLLSLPGSAAELPFVSALRRFCALGGSAANGVEPPGAVLGYIEGARVFDCDTTELATALDYYGCDEAVLEDSAQFARLALEGEALVAAGSRSAGRDARRLWSAAWRPGCCGLLFLLAFKRETVDGMESSWNPLGSLAFFADGSPAHVHGFSAARRLMGVGEGAVMQAAGARRAAAALVFGGEEDPVRMASELVLWASSAELQREPGQARARPARGCAAADEVYDAWRLLVLGRLEALLATAAAMVDLERREAMASWGHRTEQEYCNDGDYELTHVYETTALHEVWCLCR